MEYITYRADEELRTISTRTSVCHTQDTLSFVLEFKVFVLIWKGRRYRQNHRYHQYGTTVNANPTTFIVPMGTYLKLGPVDGLSTGSVSVGKITTVKLWENGEMNQAKRNKVNDQRDSRSSQSAEPARQPLSHLPLTHELRDHTMEGTSLVSVASFTSALYTIKTQELVRNEAPSSALPG